MWKIDGRVQGLEPCELELINALKSRINSATKGGYTDKALW